MIIRDLPYAQAGSKSLLLDLYLPAASEPAPVIVWMHGGAWRQGNKDNPPGAVRLPGRGYALASISYRLSHEALFPAQIHDCKAAVRWLRAHASEYNLDADRIGAWGASAGGHLAALLGTTGHRHDLEGDLGNPGISSRVQAVCDFFGPSDFLRMNDSPGSQDHNAADSPESQLVGGPIQERPDAVARANPITYIRADAAPFLIVHGDRDPLVIPGQSRLLYDALLRAGVEATLFFVPGAGHGFGLLPPAQRDEIDRLVDAFFDKHLHRLPKSVQTPGVDATEQE
jgi:acetyl esterase/lipase